MRRVYANPDLAARLGSKARADLLTMGSAEAAGQRIAERLTAIRAARRPAASGNAIALPPGTRRDWA
jgi:hypothetical protein